ncbi:hypothetical protein KDW_53350 [Dictyobacter vulcani]|uniref:Trypsin-like serine protease n=1 Tax=Dictyobacter vulcani TaxID=2607529 RepID=A0A5J4KU26_9CHLR|nr:trypsin-like peptidase domain-containing protein [Dictyobacter vulcani]GER91173.1 hypothetical protein KDW_53350 [Dictyobacter vulcani]
MYYRDPDEYHLTHSYPVTPRGYIAPEAVLDHSTAHTFMSEGTLVGENRFPAPQTPRKTHRVRTGALIVFTLALLSIFSVGLYAGWQFAGSNTSTPTANITTATTAATKSTLDSTAVQTQREVAIDKIKPSVVELQVTTNQGQAIGSGVIVDNNGDIVTNNHVVNGGQTIQAVFNDGKVRTAQLVGTVAADDLAIVRVQPFTNMQVAAIGDSSQLKVGQAVLAVGNPLGITETVTSGIVSALNRSVSESNTVTIENAIQTDAAINPGNSGGALINEQGQLVGIPTLTAINTETNTPANGVGFAIPSNVVKTALAQALQQAK